MRTKQAKVLIVEDSGFFRRTIAQSLTKEGFNVVTAEEGLKRAQEARPDIILLDLMLPRLNGMMVLRILRSTPATREIPVIVLSSDATERDIAEAERLGISHYFQKDRAPNRTACGHNTIYPGNYSLRWL
jgi:CheY-like chemotaxis protein